MQRGEVAEDHWWARDLTQSLTFSAVLYLHVIITIIINISVFFSVWSCIYMFRMTGRRVYIPICALCTLGHNVHSIYAHTGFTT